MSIISRQRSPDKPPSRSKAAAVEDEYPQIKVKVVQQALQEQSYQTGLEEMDKLNQKLMRESYKSFTLFRQSFVEHPLLDITSVKQPEIELQYS